jgi:hypothetical protein
LWLADRGWNVTAVDSSPTALEILQEHAKEKNIGVSVVLADLEAHEFLIQREAYDLIVLCNYLQRDLFPLIRDGTRDRGVVIAIIAMVDNDPSVKPMNPAFLLNPGELRAQFDGWELLHDVEGKSSVDCHRRATAQLVARKQL